VDSVYLLKRNPFDLWNLKIQWPLHQLRYRWCHYKCSLDSLLTSWMIGEFIEKDYCRGFTHDRPANYFIFKFFAPLFPYLSVTQFSTKKYTFTSYFLQLCRLLTAVNTVCYSHLMIQLSDFVVQVVYNQAHVIPHRVTCCYVPVTL